MKEPPYDEPDWRDVLNLILGAALVTAIVLAVIWFANLTGVARTR